MSEELDPVAALLARASLDASIPNAEECARLRKAAGLSLRDVGDAVGVSAQAVSSWEQPSSRGPSGQRRTDYARLLKGLADLYPPTAPAAGSVPVAEPTAPTPASAGSSAAQAARASHQRHQQRKRTTNADQARTELGARITAAVDTELERAGGDADAAKEALIKRAIPDVMGLFDATRKTGRYEHTAYPRMPDIFDRPSKTAPNLIWESRPSWRNPRLRQSPDGPLTTTALDVNAAYLSALRTRLPIGRLEHSTTGEHDPGRAGVHLITPPTWHHPHLPNPLGDREETGPLWVTEPTLRLLQRLAGPKYQLLDATPEIHESWTSGGTEVLLVGLQDLLKEARATALNDEDDVTLAYLKAMYSKFVSTLGESVHNREICRPDWTHLIRSQAFANLWSRAYKAHQAGLTLVSALGTDELHVVGDWRQVWTEGRALTEMKIKTDRAGNQVIYPVKEAN